MKKSIYLLLIILLPALCFAQANGSKVITPGEVASYTLEGNKVVFDCENNSKVLLQLNSQTVLKVWFSPDGNFKKHNQSFAVINEKLEDVGDIHVNEEISAYEIFTSQLRIRVNKSPFQLQVFDKYQKLLFEDHKDKGLVQEGNKLISTKTLRSDEQFFGLGEKGGPLNRRGKSFRMWNSDKPCYGVGEDAIYKSIPFFMSSYRYGIFFDNTYKTEFKFGTESDKYYSFEAPGGEMIYYFMFGKDYKQIINSYIGLTGKPIMPPKWALGFSQSRGYYTKEQQAREIAAEFRKRQIPCDIIYQDIGWVDGLQDFNWRKTNYTNPKQMVADLETQGFKMIISQDPVISQANKKQWNEADSLQFFTTDTRTGTSYDMPWPWGGNCGVVDFTKPGVADWWGAYQQKPLDDGVRGFWTDMGEPAWSNEEAIDRLFMKHHIGMHDEIHNVYGLTWDKVVTEQFEKRNPNKRVFQMTRAAYAGLQRYTFGWSGDSGNGNDVLQGWEQLADQIPVGLSAGLGLIPFWTTDISGYCGEINDYDAMAELYIRWMQFGVFNPLSRAHHEGDYAVEPWVFGKEAEEISKKAIEQKYRLIPYIYTYARKAYDTGLPIMRSLFLEYPNDKNTHDINHQFLFGEELLVAPVVEKGAVTKEVYLPAGQWIDYNNKKAVYKGGKWIEYEAPLHVTPIFVKKGSIIPMMPVMQYIHEKPVYPVTLDIYPAAHGQSAQFELYEDEGENNDYKKDVFCKTTVKCSTTDEGFEVDIKARQEMGFKPEGERNYIVQLHIADQPKKVFIGSSKIKEVKLKKLMEGAEDDFSTVWSWNKDEGVCYVKFPDTGKATVVLVNR